MSSPFTEIFMHHRKSYPIIFGAKIANLIVGAGFLFQKLLAGKPIITTYRRHISYKALLIRILGRMPTL